MTDDYIRQHAVFQLGAVHTLMRHMSLNALRSAAADMREQAQAHNGEDSYFLASLAVAWEDYAARKEFAARVQTRGGRLAEVRRPAKRIKTDRPVALARPRATAAMIEGLEIGTRSYNCLKRAGIDTVADLVSKSQSDLRGIPNFGEMSFAEVAQALDERGLHLTSGNGAQPATPRAPRASRGAAIFAAQMLAEHEQGDSYRVIGERYGRTGERVRQIIERERKTHRLGVQQTGES